MFRILNYLEEPSVERRARSNCVNLLCQEVKGNIDKTFLRTCIIPVNYLVRFVKKHVPISIAV